MMKKLLYVVAILILAACQKDHKLPPHPGRMIKDFKLESGQYGNATIYSENDVFKVLVRVVPQTDLTKVTPIITLSEGATISPASGEPIDVSATKKATYTVTSASGDVRRWEVQFQIYQPGISDYDTYSIATYNGTSVLQIEGQLTFNEKYKDNALVGVGAPEVASGENLRRWQEWDIIFNSTADGVKYYRLRNLNSGMFLNGVAAGSQVKQNWELKNNIDLQLWAIEESAEAGKYHIYNKANGLYLTLNGSALTSFRVTAEARQGNEKQRWAITKLPKDSYRDGDVTNFFNRTTGSVAFDQGTSIPLSDGRVLWVTQDAWYQGSLAANGNLLGNHTISYTNSIIIQPSINDWDPRAPMMTRSGAIHNIGNIAPVPAGSNRNWIGNGVELGNYVYIHGGEGNALSDVDQAIYKFAKQAGTQWNDVERLAIPNMSGQLAIVYSSGMVKANDGYVYVYGSRGEPNSFGYGSFLHVARFPHNDPTKWTFWDGTNWANTPSIAANAQISKGKATNTVSYIKGKYVYLTMDQGYYCGIPSINMYISTSTSPIGPFSEKKLVYNFTEFYHGFNAKIYTPALHVQSINGKNELLATYCINFGACSENGDNVKESDGTMDPYYYRVKGVRIPYSMIGL